MGQPHQVGIRPRRIDDDEVMALLDPAHGLGKGCEFLLLDLLDLGAEAAGDAKVHRHVELDAGPRRPVAAVLDVMGEALLPGIEIDGGDALAGLQKRDRDMHGGGRLARAAFFVPEDDDMRREGPADIRLHQHGRRNPWGHETLMRDATPAPRSLRRLSGLQREASRYSIVLWKLIINPSLHRRNAPGVFDLQLTSQLTLQLTTKARCN